MAKTRNLLHDKIFDEQTVHEEKITPIEDGGWSMLRVYMSKENQIKRVAMAGIN